MLKKEAQLINMNDVDNVTQNSSTKIEKPSSADAKVLDLFPLVPFPEIPVGVPESF